MDTRLLVYTALVLETLACDHPPPSDMPFSATVTEIQHCHQFLQKISQACENNFGKKRKNATLSLLLLGLITTKF